MLDPAEVFPHPALAVCCLQGDATTITVDEIMHEVVVLHVHQFTHEASYDPGAGRWAGRMRDCLHDFHGSKKKTSRMRCEAECGIQLV